MFRTMLGAVAILGLCLGFTMADEIKGKISKIDGNKITVTSKNDAAGKTFDVGADTKIVRKDKDGNEKEVTGGVGALKEGAGAVVTTDGNKVTRITIMGGKKKNQ